MVPDGTDDIHLSVVIPIYNIEDVIAENLRKVWSYLEACSFSSELILIDDGSRDATYARACVAAASHDGVKVIDGVRNRGKGACVAEAFGAARGSYK